MNNDKFFFFKKDKFLFIRQEKIHVKVNCAKLASIKIIYLSFTIYVIFLLKKNCINWCELSICNSMHIFLDG